MAEIQQNWFRNAKHKNSKKAKQLTMITEHMIKQTQIEFAIFSNDIVTMIVLFCFDCDLFYTKFEYHTGVSIDNGGLNLNRDPGKGASGAIGMIEHPLLPFKVKNLRNCNYAKGFQVKITKCNPVSSNEWGPQFGFTLASPNDSKSEELIAKPELKTKKNSFVYAKSQNMISFVFAKSHITFANTHTHAHTHTK